MQTDDWSCDQYRWQAYQLLDNEKFPLIHYLGDEIEANHFAHSHVKHHDNDDTSRFVKMYFRNISFHL